VRATWLGWIIGIPLVALFALIGEQIRLGGAQVLVGAGMGTAIGLAQAWVIRGALKPIRWIVACAVGLAIPFLVVDLTNAANVNPSWVTAAAVGAGGLTVGVWQALLLRRRGGRARAWIVASLVGWVLAGMTTGAAQVLFNRHALRGLWGALAYLGLITGGGLVLGLATSLALSPLLGAGQSTAG
jgi:hypothetical protein